MSTNRKVERTFKETIRHYEELRQAVYEFVEEEYKAYDVALSEISHVDAIEADSWASLWKNPKRITTWSWTRLYSDYHSNTGIKRFDLAVKANGRLQLLCYGVPSRAKLILKLHAIERHPVSNPLSGKIIDLALFAADAYARLIGSNELWLCNPVSSAHVRLYQNAGFEPKYNHQGEVTHLLMRIEE
jgi:hypothetical protein